MSILRNLFKIGKGKASDVGEAIVDKNAITLMEQEIRDAKQHIAQSKSALTDVMADKGLAERALAKLQEDAATWLEHARAAKGKGDMDLAEECAGRVADLRNQVATKEAEVQALTESTRHLEESIREASANVKAVEQRLSSIKATDKVQKAQSAFSKHMDGTNGSVTSALDSLDRIEASQARKGAKIAASREISKDPDTALQERLAAQGIGKQTTSASSILDEL